MQQKQIIEAKKKEAENDANTYKVAEIYSANLASANATIARLRKLAGDNGTVRLPTEGAKSADDKSTGKGYCDAEFYERAIKTGEALDAWIHWAQIQDIHWRIS